MKVLDRAWKNCERMWEWISENLPHGFEDSTDNIKRFIIKHLKKQWLRENKFTRLINNDCFFCDARNSSDPECESCPAVLVKKNFSCMDEGYHYALNPINFYHRILKLRKIRGRNV